MGRATTNGMSNALIYTKPQDWSDWEAWKQLERDTRHVRLIGPSYREISRLKDDYYNHGTKNRARFTELRQLVDDMYWRQFGK